jgi:hypothetical protein
MEAVCGGEDKGHRGDQLVEEEGMLIIIVLPFISSLVFTLAVSSRHVPYT